MKTDSCSEHESQKSECLSSSDADFLIIENEIKELQDSNHDILEVYETVKKEIQNTEPKVLELLRIPLKKEDRAKLCLLYEIYKNHSPYTEEWLESREKYNKMLKEYKEEYGEYCKYSPEELSRFEIEEKQFSRYNTQIGLKHKILSLNTSRNNKEIIYRKYEELIDKNSSDPEYCKLKQWLVWATEIPHDIVKPIAVDNIKVFIKEASRKLDSKLYGMEKVKEQILLYLTAKMCNPNMVNSNLGLLGPPGTGKTEIARTISEIVNLGFSQISFGGVDKAEFLKGHEYTYIGSQPGEIVNSLKRMGSKNGVVFLDELDKISDNSEIRSALLHLIDPTQNKDFRDLFLSEISIDLSQIWWISSMNAVPEDKALEDRWWIIKINGYTLSEKIQIIKNYLIPKALQNTKLPPNSLIIEDSVCKRLITKVCDSNDKGVRTLEKSIKDLVNKINCLLVHQDEEGHLPFKISFELGYKIELPVNITEKILDKILECKEFDKILSMLYI
jgi:ATP-dependent Lon protease